MRRVNNLSPIGDRFKTTLQIKLGAWMEICSRLVEKVNI